MENSKAYHLEEDFLSGLLDMTIIKPMFDCIMGKDIITGERLTQDEITWKMIGVCIDLFTLGKGAMAIKGAGLTGKQALKAYGKVVLVDGISNVAGYTAAYMCDSLGMPIAVTWALSLKFLEAGSTEGLTRAELEGIKKVDALLALNMVDYQDILDMRNAKNALEGVSNTIGSVNNLTQEQIAAINRYTGPDYKNINNSLRGFETATPENQATIDIMRETLENASLPNDMILYRGTSTKALGAFEGLRPDELVGRTIYEDAFMSTSTNSRVAMKTFSGNMQMTIEAPRGSNALDVASISQYHPESEILFNAGQSMLITSAEQRNGILYITVRIQ